MCITWQFGLKAITVKILKFSKFCAIKEIFCKQLHDPSVKIFATPKLRKAGLRISKNFGAEIMGLALSLITKLEPKIIIQKSDMLHIFLALIFLINHHHDHILDPALPRQRSWLNFVWSLSLPCLAILFDHMHPLSPVHLLHLILYLLFPLLLWVSSSTTTHFKF